MHVHRQNTKSISTIIGINLCILSINIHFLIIIVIMVVQSLYNCKQSELYTIVQLGWNACLANLATFTAFSAAYTSGLVAGRLADALAAAALPDFQARNAAAELIRIDLAAKNDEVLTLFQQLKRYIEYAFPASQWSIQQDAAGQTYYREASNLNWDSTATMLQSMVNFITANSAALLSGNNMPAGFPTTVSSAKTAFDGYHLNYLAERTAALTATEDKVNANNQIYKDLIAMFSDAKLLGFSYADMANFTFSRLLTLISGGGFSTLQGYVYDSLTSLPIAGAKVEIPVLGVMTATDSTGYYQISPLPASTYTVFCGATGYVTADSPITLTTGVTSAADFYLSV